MPEKSMFNVQEDFSDETKKDAILEEALDRFEEATEFDQENYEDAREDVAFIDGKGQWDPLIKQERIAQRRPCLVLNRQATFVDNILGDLIRNQFSIMVKGIDLAKTSNIQSVNGTDYSVAQVYEGLIRNIESRSNGQNAYLHAAQNAIGAGFGYFRIFTEYTGDEEFNQDLVLAPVQDAFMVHWDPKVYYKGPQYADYCFIAENISEKKFKRLYPNSRIGGSFDGLPQAITNSWNQAHDVTVAEYFRRVKEPGEIVLLSDGRVVRGDAFDKIKATLALENIEEVKRRKTNFTKVEWYKITPFEILKGPIEFPSSFIPVCPVFGKRLVIDGYVKLRGAVRNSKDAQRMYNYFRTALVESVALAPKQPLIASTKQLKDANIRRQWNQSNVKNFAVLLYDESEAAPPSRLSAPTVPSGMIQEVLAASQDMEWTSGMFRASVGAPSNEKSGVAIRERKDESDTTNISYTHALSEAIQYAARILVEAIPRVYDTERVVRIMNTDDTEDYIRLNQEIPDNTGKMIKLNSLDVGKFDVTVGIGPAASTQRQQASESMLQFFQILASANPQAAASIVDLIASNQDWPGADEFTERFRKLIPQELLETGDGGEDGNEQQGFTPEQVTQIVQQAVAETLQQAEIQTERIEAVAKQLKATADLQEAQAQLTATDAQVGEQSQQLVQQTVVELLTRLGQSGALRDPQSGEILTPPNEVTQ